MICPGTKCPESVSFHQKNNVSIVKLLPGPEFFLFSGSRDNLS